MAAHFVGLCLPLVTVGLCFRGIDGLAHSIWPSKGVGFIPALALLVCLPVSLVAEIVVAARYLRWRKSEEATKQDWRTVLRYPGLAATIARLVGVTTLWLVVALLLGIVVAGVVISVAAGFEHKKIAPGTLSHSRLFLPAVWVVFAFLVARYSFILPITAMRGSGSGAGWKDAVVRAKRHLGFLRLITALEYLGVTYISRFAVWMAAGVGAWHVKSIAWPAVSSAVGAVLTTYFLVLKTEMTVQVDEEVGPSGSSGASIAEFQERPDEWGLISDAGERRRFHEELRKEISKQHKLWGVAVEVVARSYRADNILVLLDNSVAEVHLTWTGKRELYPHWPRTTMFPDIGAWRRSHDDDCD